MNRTTSKEFLFSSFFILALCSCCIASFTLVLCLWNLNFHDVPKESDQKYEYQYVQHNPVTETTEFGFVTLFQELDNDECISYEDVDGNYNLVAPFGSKVYKCEGICACETSERKSTIPIVQKGVTYLTVALSSYLALEFAKKYFEEECGNKMEAECPRNSIIAETENCEEIGGASSREVEVEDQGSGKSQFTYWCKGRCESKDMEYMDNFRDEIGKHSCKDMKLEGFKLDFRIESEDGGEDDVPKNAFEKDPSQLSVFKFLGHLTKFCRDNSPLKNSDFQGFACVSDLKSVECHEDKNSLS